MKFKHIVLILVIILVGVSSYKIGYYNALENALVIVEKALDETVDEVAKLTHTWTFPQEGAKKEGEMMVLIDRNSIEVRSLALELEKQFLIDHMDADCITYRQEQFIDDAVEILIARGW